MPNKFQSLLPPNALASELALEEALAGPVTAIPVPIRDIKNADDCPVELLPWLAWEYSVDTWNTDWTEQEKRAAIKRAEFIHRHRGTAAAVEMSLSDSPFQTEIIEWFNQTPMGRPYTFLMNVAQDDRPVTREDVQDLKNAVLRAKNLRSWFSVAFHGKDTGNAFLAGYMCASETITLKPLPGVLATENKEPFLTEAGEPLWVEENNQSGVNRFSDLPPTPELSGELVLAISQMTDGVPQSLAVTLDLLASGVLSFVRHISAEEKFDSLTAEPGIYIYDTGSWLLNGPSDIPLSDMGSARLEVYETGRSARLVAWAKLHQKDIVREYALVPAEMTDHRTPYWLVVSHDSPYTTRAGPHFEMKKLWEE